MRPNAKWKHFSSYSKSHDDEMLFLFPYWQGGVQAFRQWLIQDYMVEEFRRLYSKPSVRAFCIVLSCSGG